MDRLTQKSDCFDGYTIAELCESCGESSCHEICNGDCMCCGIQAAFNRLAAYENTNLTPDEIDELKQAYADNEPVFIGLGHQLENMECYADQVAAERDVLQAKLDAAVENLALYQKPILVIQEKWSASACPRCKESFFDYEKCDDGYYTRASSLERCPYCGQNLTWNKEDTNNADD